MSPPRKYRQRFEYLSRYTDAHSDLKIRCIDGHVTSKRWNNIQQGEGCSECLLRKKDRLIRYRRSIVSAHGLELISTSLNRMKPSVFKCKAGHIFTINWMSFKRKINKEECPGCVTHTLESVRSGMMSENYLLLSSYYTNNKQKLETLCPRGHNYKVSLNSWNRGNRCARCVFDSRLISDETVARTVEVDGFSLVKYVPGTQSKIHLRCPVGHIYDTTFDNYQKGVRCRRCGGSKPEREIAGFLDQQGVRYVQRSRDVVRGKELDFYIEGSKLAIEYNGLIWHSDKYLPNDYHYLKYEACRSQGILLITIFGDDWKYRRDFVKEQIRSRLSLEEVYVTEVVDNCYPIRTSREPSQLLPPRPWGIRGESRVEPTTSHKVWDCGYSVFT